MQVLDLKNILRTSTIHVESCQNEQKKIILTFKFDVAIEQIKENKVLKEISKTNVLKGLAL